MREEKDKTLLALRVQGYAERVAKEQKDAYITTNAEILVEQAFADGVKEGYKDMTEWLNPAEELPHSDEEVMCMIHRPFQTYGNEVAEQPMVAALSPTAPNLPRWLDCCRERASRLEAYSRNGKVKKSKRYET